MIRTQPCPPGPGRHVPDPNNCPFPQGFLATLHFLDNQRSVKQLTHLFRLAPLKSAIATSIWRQEGYMAPKPKPARFVFTVGMAPCGGVDHPNDHGGPRFGCAELVSGLPSSTFAFVLRGPQAARRIERRARRAHATPMIAPKDSSAPSAALLRSSERCRFDQSRKRPDPPCECASTTGPGFATRRRSDPSRGRDAQIGHPSCSRGAAARIRRSEERRVGKEC